MHQPGNDVLAGPAFAVNEHRNVSGRDLGESITKGMHRVAVAKNDCLRWYLADGLDQGTDRICRCQKGSTMQQREKLQEIHEFT